MAGMTIADMFKSETEFEVKASEMYAVMREAAKAEILMNAANCDVPHTYIRQMATGVKESIQTPDPVVINNLTVKADNQEQIETAAEQDDTIGSGSVRVYRKYLKRFDWKNIQQIIRNGDAPDALPVGTEIKFDLKDGNPAQVVVIGTDHYHLNDCVLWFRRAIGRHCMNERNTNENGFLGSDMRRYLNEEFFNLLPDDLQEVIAPHKTIQRINGDILESTDKVFLLSECEGRPQPLYSEYNGVDEQFKYFEERRNRIAYDEDGDPVSYWTADPSSAYTTYFCFFNTGGDSTYTSASISRYVAPLIVIE